MCDIVVVHNAAILDEHVIRGRDWTPRCTDAGREGDGGIMHNVALPNKHVMLQLKNTPISKVSLIVVPCRRVIDVYLCKALEHLARTLQHNKSDFRNRCIEALVQSSTAVTRLVKPGIGVSGGEKMFVSELITSHIDNKHNTPKWHH